MDGLRLICELTGHLGRLSPAKKYYLDLKEHREKRSLDANAYCWVLLSKLADALTAEAQGAVAYSKDEVYVMMLKSYGQGGIAKVQKKDAERFKQAWKYCEEHEHLTDENSVYYRFWVGSSNYSTSEMSVFINGIVAECKEKGIDTESPERIAMMMEDWNAQADKSAGNQPSGEKEGMGA